MSPEFDERRSVPEHLVHACIVASDFERSFRFYTDVLGASPVADPFEMDLGGDLATFLDFEGDATCRVVFLRWGSDSSFVELQSYRDAGRPVERTTKDIGLARIALRVPSRDAAFERLRARAVDVNQPVEFTLPNGRVRRAFSLRDPDGNLIELIEYPEHQPAAERPGDRLTRLEDEFSIRNRYAVYCFAADDRDPVAMADCFTQDAEVAVGSMTLQGRDAIAGVQRTPSDNRHHVLNLQVRVLEPYRAEAVAYFLVLDGEGATIGHGRYADSLKREPDGAWRFDRRRIDYVWQRPDYSTFVERVVDDANFDSSATA